MDTHVTNSFQETQRLGEEFAKKVQSGETICLYGNLGAGKTTFMQGLAKGLGIERRIISPTFIIVRKYDTGVKSLYHIDLYRAETEADLESIGLEEILGDKNAITAIEWPERLGKLLPKKRWEIHFENMGEDKRKISIRKFSI